MQFSFLIAIIGVWILVNLLHFLGNKIIKTAFVHNYRKMYW
jgi:hypothetical protein